MRLAKLTVIECPPIEAPVSQCYDSNYKAGMIDDVLSATDGGTRLTPLAIASVASSIIRPIGERFDVHIPGGWGERKFKVAMVVEVAVTRYSTEWRYIVGYTDRIDGITRGDEFTMDPETRIYFDKIVNIGMRKFNHGRDEVWQPKIASAGQILRRDSLTDNRSRNRRTHSLLRPTDLFRRKDHDLSENSVISSLRSHPNVRFENKVGVLTSNLMLNDLGNNSATTHLSRSIGALVASSNDPVNNAGGNRDDEAMFDGAVERLDEPTLDSDIYLNHLRNDSDIMRDGYITYGELLDASPDWDERDTNVAFASEEMTARYADACTWNGDTTEQIAARILANGLPSIMLNSGYAVAGGLIINTNAGTYGKVVDCHFPGGYVSGIDVLAMLNTFEDTVERVLVKEVTNNGMFDIEARIEANIDTEITIDISVDGGPWEYFVYPAWASGLMPPIQTLGSETLDNLSSAITSLASGVARERNNRLTTHSSTPNLVTSLDSTSISNARDERDNRTSGRESSRRAPSFDY